MIIRFSCLTLLISLATLQGEIQSVTIGWTKGFCDKRCGELLEKTLKTQSQIAAVSVNVDEASAKMTWKPNSQFNYQMVNVPARRVGISIHWASIKVHGTLEVSSQNITLVSIGDGTRFKLLNMPPPSSNKQVEYNNIGSYKITPQLLDIFRTAQKNYQTITVSGYLFQPWRNPLAIVMQEYVIKKE